MSYNFIIETFYDDDQNNITATLGKYQTMLSKTLTFFIIKLQYIYHYMLFQLSRSRKDLRSQLHIIGLNFRRTINKLTLLFRP